MKIAINNPRDVPWGLWNNLGKVLEFGAGVGIKKAKIPLKRPQNARKTLSTYMFFEPLPRLFK